MIYILDKKIFEQIEKILLTEKIPSRELEKIRKTKEFKESSFNILNKLEDIPQEKKFHPEGNVWNHVKMVIDKGAELKNYAKDEKSFMWATLMHDIGKITTTKFIRGRWRSYDHDKKGAEQVNELLNEVSSDFYFIKKVVDLVYFHMHHIYISKDLKFGDINALIKSNNINDLMLLFASDKLGRGELDENDKINTIKELKMILLKIEKASKENYEDIYKIIDSIK